MFNLLILASLLLGLAVTPSQGELQHHRDGAQLIAQLPANPKVTSCPAKWIQPLLLPCRCNNKVPNQLYCTGQLVTDSFLSLMDTRIRFRLQYQQVMNQKAKRAQLLSSLGQFDTLVVANTGLTKLDTPVFKLFPLKNVVLDSDQLLREVHLVKTFGRRNEQQKIVELKNLILVNMENVSVDE